MLNHEELLAEWKKDSVVDQTTLRETMYSHPLLHSKYLTHLQTYKVNLRRLTLKYNKLRAIKVRYYNGELTKEELAERGWPQYLFKKPLKSEMDAILAGDADMQIMHEQILYTESLIQTAESIMKDIGNRYFLFKSLVEYEKFLSGV